MNAFDAAAWLRARAARTDGTEEATLSLAADALEDAAQEIERAYRRTRPLTDVVRTEGAPCGGQKLPTPTSGVVVTRTITYYAPTRKDLDRQLLPSLLDGDYQPNPLILIRVETGPVRRLP